MKGEYDRWQTPKPLPDAPVRSGQGELPTPSMSLLNQYLSGPSKRERCCQKGRLLKLPEVCRRSSEWQGCILQGLLNVVGWAAGRIMTLFSDSTVRFSGEKWESCQGPLPLPGQQVSQLGRLLGEDKICVCSEDVPQGHRDPQTRGGAFS